jgi:hypothetical protein
MKNRIIVTVGLLVLVITSGTAQRVQTSYVDVFENSHHPQVAYWFFAANMMPEKRYKEKIDSFAKYSKYTLIYLTERNGCNFYDIKTMHPVFEKLVAYAHQKGLKIGLQIWKRDYETTIENSDRLIQEGEKILDKNGSADYDVKAMGAREMKTILKSELFKIYAFRKTADGFYDPATLKDITASATTKATLNEVHVSVNAGNRYAGYTAYIMTQHYYNSCSNFSDQAKEMLLGAFKAYADIPFDGVGLDEYKNLKIAREKVLDTSGGVFRERLYSLGMAKAMKAKQGKDLDRLLFDMRYAPAGKPELRMAAINVYMDMVRHATLPIEAAVYDFGKKTYGKNAFVGMHNTFHNNLDRDEVWQTGVAWWSIKRDYGHSDEETSTPIQMGIGMSYKENAMYNMYYGKDLKRIWTKALYDLRYGIRTHYHAANDVQGWGVSIDDPVALQSINKVENAARLMNRFDPAFPNIKLLVVLGMEALFNWYPNADQRGMYDINSKLGMEEKTTLLWNQGYLNAVVPSDLIIDGRLHLNAKGKPELNGHEFDAVIFLDPEYAQAATIAFFKNYVNKGGKLLIEGTATHDFKGNDISEEWKQIAGKAVANSFSLENVSKLGVPANKLVDGVENANGVYTFTNAASLETGKPASFSFNYQGNAYEGTYHGLVSIQINPEGKVQKLAATGFEELKKNGKPVISLSKSADLYLSKEGDQYHAVVADPQKSVSVTFNQ